MHTQRACRQQNRRTISNRIQLGELFYSYRYKKTNYHCVGCCLRISIFYEDEDDAIHKSVGWSHTTYTTREIGKQEHRVKRSHRLCTIAHNDSTFVDSRPKYTAYCEPDGSPLLIRCGFLLTFVVIILSLSFSLIRVQSSSLFHFWFFILVLSLSLYTWSDKRT